MRKLLVGVCGIAITFGIALAQDNPPPMRVTAPSSLYPTRALESDVGGVVTACCDMTADGALTCSVSSETPTGQHFGDATIRVASEMHLSQTAVASLQNPLSKVQVNATFQVAHHSAPRSGAISLEMTPGCQTSTPQS